MDKEDLKQIKEVVENSETRVKEFVKNFVSAEIENLAQMINKSFEDTQKRLDERLSKIEYEISEMKSSIKYLEASVRELRRDLNEMKENFVYHHEFDDLESRIKLCETKLEIESGR